MQSQWQLTSARAVLWFIVTALAQVPWDDDMWESEEQWQWDRADKEWRLIWCLDTFSYLRRCYTHRLNQFLTFLVIISGKRVTCLQWVHARRSHLITWRMRAVRMKRDKYSETWFQRFPLRRRRLWQKLRCISVNDHHEGPARRRDRNSFFSRWVWSTSSSVIWFCTSCLQDHSIQRVSALSRLILHGQGAARRGSEECSLAHGQVQKRFLPF